MKIEVYRHSIFYRVCHWSIVVTGLILAFTGMQMAGLYGIKFLEGETLATHITVSFIFGCLWFLMLYYIIAKEWKWFGLGRIPYSIKFLIAETKAWFGKGYVKDPRGYNPDREEYIEKIIPTEVMVWWIYFALALLMGVTGLAMYYRLQPLIGFAASIAPVFGAYDGYALLRAVHLFGMYLFAVVVFMHVYAVIIFDVLPSMIMGRRKEKMVRE